MEQEFTLFNLDERTPLGWPEGGMPSREQGPYYCGVGPENAFGRAITDSVYKACLYAGIEISGVNGEVMPGQQEYQGTSIVFSIIVMSVKIVLPIQMHCFVLFGSWIYAAPSQLYVSLYFTNNKSIK